MCGKPATVHITKIIDGEKTKMHLCQECAQKGSAVGEGFPSQILPNIKKLEKQILDSARPKRSASDPVCPYCGTTLSEFDKSGRFSCQYCYTAFKSKVDEMLAHMHGFLEHKGKRPKRFEKASEKVAASVKNSAQLEMEFNKKSSAQTKSVAEEIVMPEPPSKEERITELKSALASAVKDERYEDAAGIRDQINNLENGA